MRTPFEIGLVHISKDNYKLFIIISITKPYKTLEIRLGLFCGLENKVAGSSQQLHE